MIPKSWFKRNGVVLRPNQELRDFLLLSSLFDLSKPGTYTVSARADIDIAAPHSGSEIKWITARSNKNGFAVRR